MEYITIHCSNLHQDLQFPADTPLLSIAEQCLPQLGFTPVNARVNNLTHPLSYSLTHSAIVDFVGLQEESGLRTYLRSLTFVFAKAIRDIFPEYHLSVRHSLAGGYYCEIYNNENKVTLDQLEQIKAHMDEIIAADLPFESRLVPSNEAIEIFRNHGEADQVDLISSSGEPYTTLQLLDGYPDNYYGSLLPSTGSLYLYDIIPYLGGVLLRVPWRHDPSILAPLEEQGRMREVFERQNRLLDMLHLSYIGSLNQVIDRDELTEVVQISEAMQEKEIAYIASEIAEQYHAHGIRIVMVSGPSSSGKTTFTKRLRTQLLVNYLRPHQISLDDYFVDRELTPLAPDGSYDFEHLEALDLNYFTSDLRRLLAGEPIEKPYFDFTLGHKTYRGELLQMGDNDLLLIEGIHALNPALIPEDLHPLTYNIYVSALTAIGLDAHNRIPSTDIRLLRRMIRDSRYRGYSAIDTLRRWQTVRAGEERWVFPHQLRADAMFNSAMMYEVAVLKPFAERLLHQVPRLLPEYSEARRLLRFLDHVRPASIDQLPNVSLLREFIGGSAFDY